MYLERGGTGTLTTRHQFSGSYPQIGRWSIDEVFYVCSAKEYLTTKAPDSWNLAGLDALVEIVARYMEEGGYFI